MEIIQGASFAPAVLMKPAGQRFHLPPSAALLPPLVAGLLQWAVWSMIRPYAWFMFYPALFLSSWIGGPMWAIPAALLSAVMVWWIFVLPETASWSAFPHNIFPMMMFMATAVGFSLFHERLRRARIRAEIALERLRGLEAFKAQFLANMLGQINQGKTRYQHLFEHMTAGFAHCSILVADDGSVDFVFLAVNPAFARLTGLGDVVGRRISALLPGAGAGNRELYENCARVARSGGAECLDSFVEGLGVWFTINISSPAKGEFIALFDSLTDQRKVEHALLEATQRLELAIRAAGIGIWEWDMRTDRLVWDDRMMAVYGWDRARFPGTLDAWSSRLHPLDAPAARIAFRAALEGGPSFQSQFRIILPGGEVRVIAGQGTIVRNSAGEPVRVIGTSRDVTQEPVQVIGPGPPRAPRFVAAGGAGIDGKITAMDIGRCLPPSHSAHPG
jgi:PAS domain-containing protein